MSTTWIIGVHGSSPGCGSYQRLTRANDSGLDSPEDQGLQCGR